MPPGSENIGGSAFGCAQARGVIAATPNTASAGPLPGERKTSAGSTVAHMLHAEYPLQKALCACLRRPAEEFGGRTFFDDEPLVHEQDAVGDLRAKPISCVTTIIVIPPRARSRITSSTSPIISGSRADVGS